MVLYGEPYKPDPKLSNEEPARQCEVRATRRAGAEAGAGPRPQADPTPMTAREGMSEAGVKQPIFGYE